jgi:hypothetical protein
MLAAWARAAFAYMSQHTATATVENDFFAIID